MSGSSSPPQAARHLGPPPVIKRSISTSSKISSSTSSTPPSSTPPPSFAPPAPPTLQRASSSPTSTINDAIDDKLLQRLDAMLSAPAVGADAEAAASEAFDMVALAAQALLAQFESLAPRLAIDSSTAAASAHPASLETRAQISLAAAGLAASVEASRRCAARKHDLLAFADDMSSAGDDVRSSSLHLVATLNQCATLAASLPATPTADDLLRVTALKSDASRHWRAATTAAQAVRGAADRFRARLADPSDSRSTSVQDQAVRDLKAADERIATLNQQLVADKSSADAAAKREAALKQESARLDALSKQLTAQLDAANARVTTLEQQLATAKSNAATAAAAAAAAAAKPAPSATPAAAAAAVAPAATTVVSLQNASSEQLAQYASDVSLKAKSDVLKEALRSASKAADELVSATLDISSDVSAFVTAAKTSAAALTRPLQLAAQILSSAAQLPIYTYEGGAEDAELLVRYKRAIFDLISEAKRIRSGDEGAAVAQLDAQQLEHRRNTVKMQLFFFGKTIEQVIYSGIWL